MNEDLNKVYQDINESPYYVEIDDFTFYFSSDFYRKKFKNSVYSYVKEEEFKLRNRYHILNINFFNLLKEVLMISLYKKIEKRGFRVYKEDLIYIESGDNSDKMEKKRL